MKPKELLRMQLKEKMMQGYFEPYFMLFQVRNKYGKPEDVLVFWKHDNSKMLELSKIELEEIYCTTETTDGVENIVYKKTISPADYNPNKEDYNTVRNIVQGIVNEWDNVVFVNVLESNGLVYSKRIDPEIKNEIIDVITPEYDNKTMETFTRESIQNIVDNGIVSREDCDELAELLDARRKLDNYIYFLRVNEHSHFFTSDRRLSDLQLLKVMNMRKIPILTELGLEGPLPECVYPLVLDKKKFNQTNGFEFRITKECSAHFVLRKESTGTLTLVEIDCDRMLKYLMILVDIADRKSIRLKKESQKEEILEELSGYTSEKAYEIFQDVEKIVL